MRELEHARQLLLVAENDLNALKGMDNKDVFADEIFGFHAQQAVEKSLKAWLSAVDGEYPLKHDLRMLFAKLEFIGCDVTTFWDLIELNLFAVRFSYETIANGDDLLDRDEVLAKVIALYDHVVVIIDQVAKRKA